MVESWITRGVDVIAVSVENQAGISTVLRKARSRGIKVITWDADAEPDARDFFVNQATPQGIGETLADEAAGMLGGKGEFAIITASLSAANQNEWMSYIKARLADEVPGHEARRDPAERRRSRQARSPRRRPSSKCYPNVKLDHGDLRARRARCGGGGRQSGRTDVKVIGLSLPNMCKPYVQKGVIDSVVLWNTRDLGYLTVLAAHALATGTLAPGSATLDAGRLGTISVHGDQVLLGKPFVFTRQNIDGFDF